MGIARAGGGQGVKKVRVHAVKLTEGQSSSYIEVNLIAKSLCYCTLIRKKNFDLQCISAICYLT